jgi:hypothetical protein
MNPRIDNKSISINGNKNIYIEQNRRLVSIGKFNNIKEKSSGTNKVNGRSLTNKYFIKENNNSSYKLR